MWAWIYRQFQRIGAGRIPKRRAWCSLTKEKILYAGLWEEGENIPLPSCMSPSILSGMLSDEGISLPGFSFDLAKGDLAGL